jgi:hypothetical protein
VSERRLPTGHPGAAASSIRYNLPTRHSHPLGIRDDPIILILIIYSHHFIINNMQNEYIDLPINVQETPKQLLEKSEPFKVPQIA